MRGPGPGTIAACAFHPEASAEASCARCFRPLCGACTVVFPEGTYCRTDARGLLLGGADLPSFSDPVVEADWLQTQAEPRHSRSLYLRAAGILAIVSGSLSLLGGLGLLVVGVLDAVALLDVSAPTLTVASVWTFFMILGVLAVALGGLNIYLGRRVGRGSWGAAFVLIWMSLLGTLVGVITLISGNPLTSVALLYNGLMFALLILGWEDLNPTGPPAIFRQPALGAPRL